MNDNKIEKLATFVTNVVVFCVIGVAMSVTVSALAGSIWLIRWVLGVF